MLILFEISTDIQFRNKFKDNKMELLQSQAPVVRQLSGSSASARHWTLDIGHRMWDMGHRNLEILKRSKLL